MDKLRIYVCGHSEETLSRVPDRPFLHKVNLNTLPIGKFQDNQLSESRIYLSELIKEPCEYIGFTSYSWGHRNPELPRLQKLNLLDYQPDVVYYARATEMNWLHRYYSWNPGVEKYMEEIAKEFGLSKTNYPAPLSNNFMCHWDVFQKFHSKWMEVFMYLYDKYPPDKLEFEIGLQDPSRHAGYLYEYITVLVFASMSGLRFQKVKLSPTKVKLPHRLF